MKDIQLAIDCMHKINNGNTMQNYMHWTVTYNIAAVDQCCI